MAYSILRNAQDAEDVVQETFLSCTACGPGKTSTTSGHFALAGPGVWRLTNFVFADVQKRPTEPVEIPEIEIQPLPDGDNQ